MAVPDVRAPASGPVKLIEILQGKWLGHPLHPAVVHVPLGLWLIAPILDVLVWFEVQPVVLARLAFYCVLLGLLAALVAVPTGIAEWVPIKKEKPAWKLGLYHMVLNLVALLIWAGNFGLRVGAAEQRLPITLPILITSIIAALLVLVGGYLGSLMVFDQGTSIARLSKKKWRSLAREGGARVPDDS